MKIIVKGADITSFADFVTQVTSAATTAAGKGSENTPYFGFDLNSFGDCLYGGFIGSPPYDIIVEDCRPFVDAMGHRGLVGYCEDMLRLIDAGGRGLVQEESRHWYEETLRRAQHGTGPTLLDLIMEVVGNAPASLTLLTGHVMD